MSNIYPLPELVYIPIHDWQEEDTVIVIKQEAAWQALHPRDLDWDIGIDLNAPLVATEEAFDLLVDQADGMGDIIYAVGGGVTVDAAKYIANELELPLISVPTALSVDAFFTSSSGVRKEGCVRYIETLAPEIMLLDLDVIGRAPQSVRAAGIVDVLSIAIGCFDWKLGEARGKNPSSEKYDPNIDALAEAILQIALACAEAAGQGDPQGLKSLINALAMEVQLCNLIGHSRPEEGSEHYFAYCAEALSDDTTHAHGEFVGPGIVLMAERQSQDVTQLHRALDAANVDYVRKHSLPYGIAWELAKSN